MLLKRLDWRFSRRTTAALAVLGGAVALMVALPSRGQQPSPGKTVSPSQESGPMVQLVAPPVALTGPSTRADLTFTLPTGFQLARNPRLRVVNDKDELVELLPTYISQRSPVGTGYRDLHTENYLPGMYRVRAEVDYRQADGKTGIAITPWFTLTMPAR